MSCIVGSPESLWLCRYDEYDLADRLKERHWQLPPYTLPPDAKCAAPPCLLQMSNAACLSQHGLELPRAAA